MSTVSLLLFFFILSSGPLLLSLFGAVKKKVDDEKIKLKILRPPGHTQIISYFRLAFCRLISLVRALLL